MKFIKNSRISVECVGGIKHTELVDVEPLPKQHAITTACRCIKAKYVIVKGEHYIKVQFTPTKIVKAGSPNMYMTAKQVKLHYGKETEDLIITAKVHKDGNAIES